MRIPIDYREEVFYSFIVHLFAHRTMRTEIAQKKARCQK
ncbi:hypothetical protein Pla110_20040 [Polystyrenella longa]|uniref:Uncharacterized protein n=1 Tax=Polystyrenella longa TaxID=2528007 RepID=A0A518CM25_9PLAN|nr:hypothetical protein Pla110_20040 [Polystyrenella longa]